MAADLFQAEIEQLRLPPHIRLICGKPALERAVGKQAVKDALASTAYGSERRKPRATWWPYVYPVEDGWVVSCEDPDKMRRNNWRTAPAYQAALRWAAMLADGHRPVTPSDYKIITNPHDWILGAGFTLFLDTEGYGRIDRISVCDGQQLGSFQWSRLTRDLLEDLLVHHTDYVAHNASFDRQMLHNEGLEAHGNWHCTMVAHRLLHPWQSAKLGSCAPLYAMLSPWKHKATTDPETYNLMDTAVLPPMFWAQQQAITDQHIEGLYRTEVDLSANRTLDIVPGHNGHSLTPRTAPIINAAGLVYPTTKKPLEHTVWLENPEAQVAGALCGEPIVGVVDKHFTAACCLGFGPQQIRKGCLWWEKCGAHETMTMAEAKAAQAEFLAANPAFHEWRQLVDRLAKKERWVSNPFGRRLTGVSGTEYHRALIWSTASDSVKTLARNSPTALLGLDWCAAYYTSKVAAEHALQYTEDLPINLEWSVQ